MIFFLWGEDFLKSWCFYCLKRFLRVGVVFGKMLYVEIEKKEGIYIVYFIIFFKFLLNVLCI